jgi:hypothetical protein
LNGGVKSIEFTCVPRVIAATFVGLLTCAVQAQDKSFYFGQPVHHPEALSGLWKTAEVGVFDWRGRATQREELNYFTDFPARWGLRFEDGRLTLHFVSSFAGTPSIDLDLVQQPRDQWVGHLPRGWFDSLMSHYGELMKVRPEGHGRFSFELYSYSGACCAQVTRQASWRKIRGDSCIAERN